MTRRLRTDPVAVLLLVCSAATTYALVVAALGVHDLLTNQLEIR